MAFQEILKSMQLVGDAFDIVQTIATNDEHGVPKPVSIVLDQVLCLLGFAMFGKPVWVYADWEGSNGSNAVIDNEGPWSGSRGATKVSH